MRVAFNNLGCKLNQAELEHLARSFAAVGHEVVPDPRTADLHVINTCTVTHVAARKSRKVARRSKRLNPEVMTVLTGCWVAADPAAAASLAGVDLVVDNSEKNRLLERVHEALPQLGASSTGEAAFSLPPLPLDLGRARAMVKVEDGCSMGCSFCVIPSTRGRQRSRPLPEVVREVQGLAVAGHREVVVTGVQISHYRWQGRGLYELACALLDQTGVERLRLTSIAPWSFDDRLFGLFEAGRVCRHLHLSLQSGCSDTLRRMRRPYSAATFLALVDRIRSAVPGIAVTTDVIVGFPGETEQEFERSLRFVATTGFAMVHAFPYSARPGTEAAAMGAQVPDPVKRERMARMLAAGADAERRFRQGRLGHREMVLWERRRRDGLWQGTSDNYLRVITSGDSSLTQRITATTLERIEENGDLMGRVLPDATAAAIHGRPA